MKRVIGNFVFWNLGIGICFIFLVFGDVLGFTEVMKGAKIQAKPDDVKAIISAFEKAEKALQKEKVKDIMSFYSPAYNNWGLGKKQTEQVWSELFVKYDQLSSRHVFSEVVIEEGKASVTCTGAIFGSSVLEKKGKPSPAVLPAQSLVIDSWFNAVHYLVLEKGEWKLIGHDPGAGKSEQFGAGIHLLF